MKDFWGTAIDLLKATGQTVRNPDAEKALEFLSSENPTVKEDVQRILSRYSTVPTDRMGNITALRSLVDKYKNLPEGTGARLLRNPLKVEKKKPTSTVHYHLGQFKNALNAGNIEEANRIISGMEKQGDLGDVDRAKRLLQNRGNKITLPKGGNIWSELKKLYPKATNAQLVEMSEEVKRKNKIGDAWKIGAGKKLDVKGINPTWATEKIKSAKQAPKVKVAVAKKVAPPIKSSKRKRRRKTSSKTSVRTPVTRVAIVASGPGGSGGRAPAAKPAAAKPAAAKPAAAKPAAAKPAAAKPAAAKAAPAAAKPAAEKAAPAAAKAAAEVVSVEQSKNAMGKEAYNRILRAGGLEPGKTKWVKGDRGDKAFQLQAKIQGREMWPRWGQGYAAPTYEQAKKQGVLKRLAQK